MKVNEQLKNKRLGESNINYEGYKMTIIEYKKSNDIMVQFENGNIQKTTYHHFKYGDIKKDVKQDRIGATNYNNNQHCLMTVVEYIDSNHVLIQFNDDLKTTKETTWVKFERGQVRNPNIPMKCAIPKEKRRKSIPNVFIYKGEYWEGILSNGDIFLFSNEDYEWISKTHWSKTTRTGYLQNNKKEKMHKLVLINMLGYDYTKENLVCDHINRNRLDNRRENLRAATNSENGKNKKEYDNGGVVFNKNANKWMAYVNENKIHYHLGYFEDKEDALRVRKEAVDNLEHGVLPKTNTRNKFIYKNESYNFKNLCDLFGIKYRSNLAKYKKGISLFDIFKENIEVVS